MNEPSGSNDAPQGGEAPKTDGSRKSTARYLLGCLGKALLIFLVVAVLVFGACLVMIY